MALMAELRAKGVSAVHFECQLGDWMDKLDQGAAEWDVWTCRAFGAGVPMVRGAGRSGEEALRRVLAEVHNAKREGA